VAGILTFVDVTLVHVPSSYSWIATKHFRFNAPLTDADLLVAVLDHEHYGDHYASAASQTGLDVHGPYRRPAINAANFVPTTRDAARAFVNDWASNAATEGVAVTSTELTDFLISPVPPIDAVGAAIYRLSGLGKADQWEGNPVGWNDGFHEFIAIDHANATLALIVASDD
jgi:hypothetical protein